MKYAVYNPPGLPIGLRAQGTREQEAGPDRRPLAPPTSPRITDPSQRQLADRSSGRNSRCAAERADTYPREREPIRGERLVVNPVTHLLEKRALHQAVGSALQSGVGFYKRSWPVAGHNDQELGDELLDWCRITLGEMHRPYGVDSVSLALLVHAKEKRPVATAQFSVLRPVDFYRDGAAEVDAREVLQTWYGEGILSRRGVRLSALLFSWGDLAQDLVSES